MTADAGDNRPHRSEDRSLAVVSAESERTQPEVKYRAALEAVGAVAAPVSIATALAYYIGVQRQAALAGALGLDVSVLGLSTRDYVVRSTDTLVRFLAVLFVAALVLTALAAGLRPHLAARSQITRRRLAQAVLMAGTAMVSYGLFRLFNPVPLSYRSLVDPICLMAGSGLSTAGLLSWQAAPAQRSAVLGRWGRALIAVAGAGLLLVGLFWVANDYAYLQGRQRGLELQTRVDALPEVVLYSRSPLHTSSQSVAEQLLTSAEGQPTYRYEGLRLLLRSDGKYFLLPAEPPGRQPVVVLSEDQIDWVEFIP